MIWTILVGAVLFLCFCGPVAVVRFFLGVLTFLGMLVGILYLIHLSFPEKPAVTQANAFALPDAQPQESTGPQGNTMNQLQREEAYRTASAMENQKPVPSESQDRMDFTREALERASDLQQTLSKMTPAQRAPVYVKLSQLSDAYGASVQGPIKDVLKKVGLNLDQYDPQTGKMMQQYAALRDVFAEERYKSRITDPERQSLIEEIGSPTQGSFPDRLNGFARTVAQSLDKQVDFGLAQRWGLPVSVVNDANRYKNPGALADNPVPVNNQADYDKLQKGQWFLDSSGKPTLKQ